MTSKVKIFNYIYFRNSGFAVYSSLKPDKTFGILDYLQAFTAFRILSPMFTIQYKMTENSHLLILLCCKI